jgi:hypothetical protein
MIFQSLLPIRISLRKDYDIPELVFNQDFIEKGLLRKQALEYHNCFSQITPAKKTSSGISQFFLSQDKLLNQRILV